MAHPVRTSGHHDFKGRKGKLKELTNVHFIVVATKRTVVLYSREIPLGRNINKETSDYLLTGGDYEDVGNGGAVVQTGG